MKEIGFIDPSSFGKREIPEHWSIEDHEKAAETIAAALSERTARMNAAIREKMPVLGERDLIGPDGRVDAEAFRSGNGGPHDEDSLAKDRLSVETYRENFGSERSAGRSAHDGELGEGAAFCVLNRMLGGRFLVVRTAEYDDYRNLVDFMVVDLEKGGQPVCAIDELVGTETGNLRVSKKKERLKGGASLRYGIEAADDGLVLGEYRGLPGLYAATGRKELKALFDSGADLSTDEGDPSPAEREFFGTIIGSMRAYAEEAGIPGDSPAHEFLRVAAERLERGSDVS